MTPPLTLACPGSKSMTQRALIIGALAEGPCRIVGALDCDDSRYLAAGLERLGCTVRWHDGGATALDTPVEGAHAGAPAADRGSVISIAPRALSGGARLYLGNAGTAVRFGSALSLVCNGPLEIDGDERMRARPIGALAGALEQLGIAVRYLGRSGYPPLRLQREADPGAEVTLDATLSSQFASALALVAPRLDRGLSIALAGDAVVSRPYLEMTVQMIRRAGATAAWSGVRTLEIAPGGYRAGTLEVEPDWSTAAFLLAAARLVGRPIEIPGLPDAERSLQGDAAFSRQLEELEADRAHDFDLTDTPDLIAPLTALALFCERPTRIRGAAHTRVKECDRIHVLCRELSKLGGRLREHADGIDIEPLALARPGEPRAVALDPENDHRMAMAFALVGLRVAGVRVLQPECVTKSFPGFWEALERIAPGRPSR